MKLASLYEYYWFQLSTMKIFLIRNESCEEPHDLNSRAMETGQYCNRGELFGPLTLRGLKVAWVLVSKGVRK